jgi:hypothetical protein
MGSYNATITPQSVVNSIGTFLPSIFYALSTVHQSGKGCQVIHTYESRACGPSWVPVTVRAVVVNGK